MLTNRVAGLLGMDDDHLHVFREIDCIANWGQKGRLLTEDDLEPLFEAVRLMQHHAASIPTLHDWQTEAAQRVADTAAECSVIARAAYDAIALSAALHTFDQKYVRLFPPDKTFPSWAK